MWILQTFGKQFYLTTTQKDAYLESIGRGAKFVKCGDLILSDHFDFIVSEEESKKHLLLGNPILRDEDFKKYIETGESKYARLLDARYPLPKYQQQWDEAQKNKNAIFKLAVPQ